MKQSFKACELKRDMNTSAFSWV